ncbi:MAG: nucleoside 2-deoxyribosyltransferase [Cyanobacteria bacterium P01_H01_bin.74]
MLNRMLCPTELVYLAGPYQTEVQQQFNRRVASLARSYNFPMLLPQEAKEEIRQSGCLPDWQPTEKMLETPFSEARLPEFLKACCMDSITRANLVVAIAYQNQFHPETAFEVGYAIGRRVNVLTVNHPTETLAGVGESLFSLLSSPEICQQVVTAPDDNSAFPDRLIPLMNRFFEPHRL